MKGLYAGSDLHGNNNLVGIVDALLTGVKFTPRRWSDHPDRFSGVTFFQQLSATLVLQTPLNDRDLFTSPLNETPSETGGRIRPAPGPLYAKLTHYHFFNIFVDFYP